MAQDGQVVVGDNATLYYDASGANSGTFANLVPTVDEITLGDSRQTGDLNERGKSFIVHFTGKRDIVLGFTMPFRPGNDHFDAIHTVYKSGADIGLLVLSGPKATAGHVGIKADWKITKFEISNPNDANPSTVSCEAMLSGDSTYTPTDHTTS